MHRSLFHVAGACLWAGLSVLPAQANPTAQGAPATAVATLDFKAV